jgi:hypothetical protein
MPFVDLNSIRFRQRIWLARFDRSLRWLTLGTIRSRLGCLRLTGEYKNFTHLLDESIDTMFQWFMVIVNNMRVNVTVLPYDDRDRAVKLLHSLDRTIWGAKVEAILESGTYETLMVDGLLSKLKSAEVDRAVTAKIESPTDSHSLTLNSRTNLRVCFKCGKTGHFFIECPKMNSDDKHKSKDKGRRSNMKDHGHGRKAQTRKKIKKSSDVDIDSDSEDMSSSSSDEEEEYSKRRRRRRTKKKKKKKKKNLSKYLNGLCCAASKSPRSFNREDGFCGMAHSASSKISQKDASDSYSEDEVCDELSSLCKENEELDELLNNRDHMLREAKKLRKELRYLLEEAREKVADLELKNLDAKLEIESLNAALVVSDEVDCGECTVFLADLTALKEKHVSKCEELDVLRVNLDELKSRLALLGSCTSCPLLHASLDESRARIIALEAALKSPIATACSTCEVHVVQNLELGQCVDRLQDENDRLSELLSWLPSQEPQLGMMIAGFKLLMVRLWGLIKLVRTVVREKGKLGMF